MEESSLIEYAEEARAASLEYEASTELKIVEPILKAITDHTKKSSVRSVIVPINLGSARDVTRILTSRGFSVISQNSAITDEELQHYENLKSASALTALFTVSWR